MPQASALHRISLDHENLREYHRARLGFESYSAGYTDKNLHRRNPDPLIIEHSAQGFEDGGFGELVWGNETEKVPIRAAPIHFVNAPEIVNGERTYPHCPGIYLGGFWKAHHDTTWLY